MYVCSVCMLVGLKRPVCVVNTMETTDLRVPGGIDSLRTDKKVK